MYFNVLHFIKNQKLKNYRTIVLIFEKKISEVPENQ